MEYEKNNKNQMHKIKKKNIVVYNIFFFQIYFITVNIYKKYKVNLSISMWLANKCIYTTVHIFSIENSPMFLHFQLLHGVL